MDRPRVAAARRGGRRREPLAGARRAPRGLSHVLAQDVVPRRRRRPMVGRRDDRLGTAHRPLPVPRDPVSPPELFDTHAHLHFPEFTSDLPDVLIHCREAHEDVLRILGEGRVGEIGGIMHCFSGDAALARRCLDLGLAISLAGPVTYPNARALPDVARLVPGDRLVIETDCPFLPPQGHRGRRNEPAYLALTAARVAELRGEALETLAARLSDNARRLFKIP